jgi:hypothetical protein
MPFWATLVIIVCVSLALGWVITWLKHLPPPPLRRDVFLVYCPGGVEKRVVGHLTCDFRAGVLYFREPGGMVTETYSPTGWHAVVKIEDGV